MDYKKFIKKEENWGFISLILGIVSLPFIILFPISNIIALILSFIGFVLGLIYLIKNTGFGWDKEKKLALYGLIVNSLSIIINIALFTTGVLYVKYFG